MPRPSAKTWTAVVVGALVAVTFAAGPVSAEIPNTPSPFTTVDPNAPAVTPEIQAPEAPPADSDQSPTLIVNPQIGAVGDTVRVAGQLWPANSSVVLTTCGNLGIGGSEVCSDEGQVTQQVDNTGAFSSTFVFRAPPVPCPCVVTVTSPQTTQSVDIPVEIQGLPTAPVVNNTPDTRVSSSVRLTGSGPVFWGWFGGTAKRTAKVTVENLGSDAIQNVQLNVSYGKGQDPTDGSVVFPAGSLNGGQVATFDVPIEFEPWSFGEQTVKVTLGNVTSQTDAVRASVSIYPWGLVIVLLLLLQPILLALYKARPDVEGGDFDPLLVPGPGGAGPVPSPSGAGPTGAPAPELAGVAAAGAAATLAGAALVQGPAPGSRTVLTTPGRPADPGYRPVYGVTDLEAYLDPGAAGARRTVAPRIIIGGVVPSAPDGTPQ